MLDMYQGNVFRIQDYRRWINHRNIENVISFVCIQIVYSDNFLSSNVCNFGTYVIGNLQNRGLFTWKKNIGMNIHNSVYEKREDFRWPIAIFPWLSGKNHRLITYGVYSLQVVWSTRCCTSVLDFNSKNLQVTSKSWTKGYRHHKLRSLLLNWLLVLAPNKKDY